MIAYPKGFRWRQPDPTAHSGVKWGLGGASLAFTGSSRPAASARSPRSEGEKSVDRLVELGIAACCPPVARAVGRTLGRVTSGVAVPPTW